MNARRSGIVAAMHLRDLFRRRLALAIVVLLPLVFYLSGDVQPTDPALEQMAGQTAAEDLWPLAAGAIGAGWAIAVAALFVLIGSRRFDQPLLLAGFRPTELLVGRLLSVLALAAVVTPLFALVIRVRSGVDLATTAAAIGLCVVVSVAIGVLAAALVPREMEGVLLIIGVIGMQMSPQLPTWMPMWGPVQLVRQAGGLSDAASTGAAVTHAVIATAVLMCAGGLVWARRLTLRKPDHVIAGQAVEAGTNRRTP